MCFRALLNLWTEERYLLLTADLSQTSSKEVKGSHVGIWWRRTRNPEVFLVHSLTLRKFSGYPREKGLTADSYGYAHVTLHVLTTAMWPGDRAMFHMSINCKCFHPHLTSRAEAVFCDLCALILCGRVWCRQQGAGQQLSLGKEEAWLSAHRGCGKWQTPLVSLRIYSLFLNRQHIPGFENQGIRRMCYFKKPHFCLALMDRFSSPASITCHLLVSLASLCKWLCSVLYLPLF